MIDPVRELKIRADRLHAAIDAGDVAALARVPGLAADEVQRKHCLAAVARELGFRSWAHAKRVLEGDPEERDLGTLLYPRENAPYPNLWFASYDEARAQRETRGGWLLGYREQFVVADREFVEALSLDPDDPDWARIGWDWARPREMAARTQLYAKLIATR